MKLNSSDFKAGGLSPAEAVEVAALLDDQPGGVDLIEVSGGNYEVGERGGEHGERGGSMVRGEEHGEKGGTAPPPPDSGGPTTTKMGRANG